MRVTTKGRYALRAVTNLAKADSTKPTPIKLIAQEEGISPEFLEQIFFRLKRSGLIRSVRGPGGGFLLNRDPETITIQDIFEAVGEGVDLTPCSSCSEIDKDGFCDRKDICPIHGVWEEVTVGVSKIFTDFTLDKVLSYKPSHKESASILQPKIQDKMKSQVPLSPEMNEALHRASLYVRKAHVLTAFTGAGMSVESGIPPFRGSDGIWNKYDPGILDLSRFKTHPEKSWPVIREIFYDHFSKAQPNPGHIVLAEMEDAGLLKVLITQNIDDLHYRAGNRSIVEYHGNSRLLICPGCLRKYEAAETNLDVLPPRCPECAEVLKPDFVFFGEAIPLKAVREAQQAMRDTDCLLIIGTTGEVYPAAALPPEAKRWGAKIIEINPTPSAFTETISDVYIPLPSGKALPLLWDLVRKEE